MSTRHMPKQLFSKIDVNDTKATTAKIDIREAKATATSSKLINVAMKPHPSKDLAYVWTITSKGNKTCLKNV